MKRFFYSMILVAGLMATLLNGCTATGHSMREPNARMQWEKSDFSYSGQVTGEATTTRILMIDWKRLFKSEAGTVEGGVMSPLPIDIASVPVIGTTFIDRTSNYALFDMMEKNPGYDVVFYPQYEKTVKRPIGLGFIVSTTTVKVTARLAKLD